MDSNGTVRLYHPSGAMCSFTIPGGKHAMAWIADYLNDGFLALEPEPVEGEKVDPIGWVCRRSRMDMDGKEIPILDCYVDHPAMTKKFITVYLNTDKQREEFEGLAGCSIEDAPFWVGDKSPERGVKADTDKYICRLPNPVGVVHKPNPKYNPTEEDISKRKPKRLFVRWQAVTVSPQQDDQRHDEPDDEQPLTQRFEWTANEMRNLLHEAGLKGWSVDQVKLALDLKTGWNDLIKFETYEQAWQHLNDYYNDEVAVSDIPF